VTYRNADWTTANSSANDNTTLYTGRTLDLATALYYYRARYYDAGLERFVSRDPIGYRGGADLYEYVGDSPVTGSDPGGKDRARESGFCVHAEVVADPVTGAPVISGGPESIRMLGNCPPK
jgi:RHS repeat-associated protein